MNLDIEVEASGFGKGESRKLEEYMEMINEEEDDEGSETEEDYDSDEQDELEEQAAEDEPEDELEEQEQAQIISSEHSQCIPTIPEDALTLEPNPDQANESEDKPTKESRRKKKPESLTTDQLALIVANRLERIKLANQRKHHSKKSVKSIGKQKGSKLKTDKKQLISLEF